MRTVSAVVLASVLVLGPAWAEGEANLISIEARAEIGTKTISMPFEPRLDTRYEFEHVTVLLQTSRAGAFKRVKVEPSLVEAEDGFAVLDSDPALVWRKTSGSGPVRSGSLSLALDARIARGDEFCVSVRVGGEDVVRVARAFAAIRMLGVMTSTPAPDVKPPVATPPPPPTSDELRALKACRDALKRVTKSKRS